MRPWQTHSAECVRALTIYMSLIALKFSLRRWANALKASGGRLAEVRLRRNRPCRSRFEIRSSSTARKKIGETPPCAAFQPEQTPAGSAFARIGAIAARSAGKNRDDHRRVRSSR